MTHLTDRTVPDYDITDATMDARQNGDNERLIDPRLRIRPGDQDGPDDADPASYATPSYVPKADDLIDFEGSRWVEGGPPNIVIGQDYLRDTPVATPSYVTPIGQDYMPKVPTIFPSFYDAVHMAWNRWIAGQAIPIEQRCYGAVHPFDPNDHTCYDLAAQVRVELHAAGIRLSNDGNGGEFDSYIDDAKRKFEIDAANDAYWQRERERDAAKRFDAWRDALTPEARAEVDAALKSRQASGLQIDDEIVLAPETMFRQAIADSEQRVGYIDDNGIPQRAEKPMLWQRILREPWRSAIVGFGIGFVLMALAVWR